MYLINTTFQAEESVAADFISSVTAEFIPAVERDSKLHSSILSRLKLAPEQTTPGTETTALQFRAPSAQARDEYLENILPAFLESTFKRWGQKVLYFTSVLEIIR